MRERLREIFSFICLLLAPLFIKSISIASSRPFEESLNQIILCKIPEKIQLSFFFALFQDIDMKSVYIQIFASLRKPAIQAHDLK